MDKLAALLDGLAAPYRVDAPQASGDDLTTSRRASPNSRR
jgi:hypothetical protein